MSNPGVLPTLPSLPALDSSAGERAALLAGLTFIEGAAGWRKPELVGWFNAYGGLLGLSAPPPVIVDPVVGTMQLEPGAPLSMRSGQKTARADELPKLLAMARWRVVITLRGLLARPADDRFLQAAIFAGRVKRVRNEWLAEAKPGDALSDIVLSLFAVDVLSYREFHEQNLCVCDVCGRISYNPATTTRAGCSEHIPASGPPSAPTSGFQGRTTRQR